MFKKKKNDEERLCALCVYAEKKGGKYRCKKKNRETGEEDLCPSYEFDLTKYRPAPFPDMTLEELPEI